MFYDTAMFKKPLPPLRDDRTHALVVLVPRESKRLLAKAVLQMPEVKRAHRRLVRCLARRDAGVHHGRAHGGNLR